MNILETGLKRNLNIRPRKDEDLLLAIKKAGYANFGNGDYSHYVRELMRDGIRLRQLIKSGKLSGDLVLSTAPPEEEEEDLEAKYGALVDEGMMADGRI